jgi:geranylgeranyl pyrophosphate synthase
MLFRGIALLAGASSEVSEKYAVCGYKLGTLYQLMNDLISCYAPTMERHSLVRKKVTLPVAYALCSRSSELIHEFKTIWNTSLAPVDQLHRLEELVLLTGGVTATLMTMQGIYNQLAILLNSQNEYDLQILQIAQDCLKIDQYLKRA